MIPALHAFVLAVGSSLPASIVTKATVIAGLGLIGSRLARRQRAAVRHVLLAATFGVLLLLPVASLVVPPVRIAVPVAGQNNTMLPPPAGAINSISPITTLDTHIAAAPVISRSPSPSLYVLLITGWFVGAALSLIPMIVSLWNIRLVRRSGLPWADGQSFADVLALDAGIHRRVEVRLHTELPGPIASGILHSAIFLPADAQTWEREDLSRALVHELEHVRRGDFMTHSLARVACAMYWFHPLVWIARRQLVLEAERSCDDAVIARSEATAYADQLVGLARRLLVATKLPVLAMASRSDLVIRVTAVLDGRQRRGRAGAIALTLACAVATALVLTISPLRMVSAPQSASGRTAAVSSPPLSGRAPTPSFEVASIKPDPSPSGLTMFQGILPSRFTAKHVTAKALIAYAYNVRDFQISGGPAWINSAEYDIAAKPEDVEAARLEKVPWEQYREEYGLLVQSLLTERFKLKVSHATKDLPVYALVVAKNGPKLTLTKGYPTWLGPGPKRGPWISVGSGQLTSVGMSLNALANTISEYPDLGGRKVLDQTGLQGNYDISLRWTPDQRPAAMPKEPEVEKLVNDIVPPPESSVPSFFTAIQEQLGLKLQSTKGPVEIIVIDQVERPSEN